MAVLTIDSQFFDDEQVQDWEDMLACRLSDHHIAHVRRLLGQIISTAEEARIDDESFDDALASQSIEEAIALWREEELSGYLHEILELQGIA